MTALQNFEALSAELIRSGATPKAAAFAEKISAQVRAMGAEWIEANALKLHVALTPEITQPGTVEYTNAIAPVCDNRAYYISEWQAVLMGL
ncbi:MAG: hypothetical protein KBA75_10905 [Alphaproteobacteria bacterium]|nr:hypothetical protein [Alphaproteobacteria bacterium]